MNLHSMSLDYKVNGVHTLENHKFNYLSSAMLFVSFVFLFLFEIKDCKSLKHLILLFCKWKWIQCTESECNRVMEAPGCLILVIITVSFA